MIDINLLRNNPDKVRENIKRKFQDKKLPLVDEVLTLDKKNRELKQESDKLRAELNLLSGQIGKLLKEGKPKEAEEFQVGYALEFLEKYPKFKCMVNVESQFNGDIKIMLNSIKEAFLGDIDYF